MATTIEQVCQSLVKRGLASEQQAAALLAEHAAARPGSDDGAEFLQGLVERGQFSRYQADVLAGRADGPLVVGPYEIQEQIVQGRLAGLFRARQQTLLVPVCLKVLRPAGRPAQQEEQLSRFQREARVSVQVDHPHVVRTWQVGQDGDIYFIAYEDLRGHSLAEALDAPSVMAEGSVPQADWLWDEGRTRTRPQEVCRLVREAALGLAHLHDQGIVHRDVRPANVWITEEGHVKVMDFGLARDALAYIDSPLAEEQSAGPSGFLGTTDYLSLEQALDSASAGPASDVYSLGCTLYHALTGRVPFIAATPAKQMLLHASQQASPPSQHNQDVPEALDEVVASLMAKDPEDRYQSCAAVAEALQPFAEGADHPPHEVAKTPVLMDFLRWLKEEAFVYGRPPAKKRAAPPPATSTSAAPTGWQLGGIRSGKVLFATDFSQLSDAALAQATALARDSDAKLLIVHVEEPPSAYGGGELYYGVPEPDHHALRTMLEEIRPDDPSVKVEHHLLMGDPASEIAALAEQEQVDLIVIGTHGRTGLSRLLIGSTAEAVVRKAPCAVLTVKMPHK